MEGPRRPAPHEAGRLQGGGLPAVRLRRGGAHGDPRRRRPQRRHDAPREVAAPRRFSFIRRSATRSRRVAAPSARCRSPTRSGTRLGERLGDGRRRDRSAALLAGGRKAENFGKLMERLLTFRKLNKVGRAPRPGAAASLGEGEHRSRCAFWRSDAGGRARCWRILKAKRLEFVSAGDGVRSLQALAAELAERRGGAPQAVALSAAASASPSSATRRPRCNGARRRSSARCSLRSSRLTSSSSRGTPSSGGATRRRRRRSR